MLRTPFYQTRGGKTQCPRWNVSGLGWELWLRAQCQGILDVVVGQGTLDGVEIADSARKHGVGDSSILHAWENAITLAECEYDGEERLLVIGRTPRAT